MNNDCQNYFTLGDIFKVSSGGTPSRKKNEYFNGDIPWVKTGDLKGVYANKPKEFITQLGLDNSSAKIFPPNTVLLAMYGATIGACSILSFEAATNQACAAILPNDNYEEKYLYYYFSYIKPSLIRMGVGGAQPNISAGLIKKLKIPNILLEEQKKIAEILDTADSLRQKDQQLVEHYDRLSQSLFLDMFGEPTKNPHNWELVTLDKVSKKITDGTHQSPSFISEGVPFLLVSNIIKNEITYKTKKYISEEEYQKLTKNTPIEIGDILYTTVGSYGKPAIVKSAKKFCFQRHIAQIKLNHNLVDVDFIKEMMLTDFVKRQADRLAVGVAQKTLNLKAIKSMVVMAPPIELQKVFAQRNKEIEKQKKLAQQSLKKSEDLFNSLLQRAFKGELTNS